ncbi:hypothetical protein ABH920_002347 [Catenulispora sp. EB89]|uniref:Fic family protein n=1 Tax=Catenulispora sp. EB89 TaxID=3156257 RepID=UPI003515BD99
MIIDLNRGLDGTPYLLPTGEVPEKRLDVVENRAKNARSKAIEVQARIQSEAHELLLPYLSAVRSDLVAESNSIEDMPWTTEQVRDVVATYRELLDQSVGTIVEALRSDPRVFQAVGLYKAHLIADEWAKGNTTPRQFEIRSLHGLIMAGGHYAGNYKQAKNDIGGTNLKTAAPWDTQRVMGQLADWWSDTKADPVLTATVIHAWLTHIHPFDDGNGRMARLLANMALAQHSYPPLLVRSGADRGQYYDCLAASDEGDILPLYDLFVQILRRTVRSMSSPNYVRDIVQGRFLASWSEKLAMWRPLVREFAVHLNSALLDKGWSAEVQGLPDVRSFSLLASLASEGNSWFLKVFGQSRQPEWLLWFGFNSPDYVSAVGSTSGYPSIFASVRDPSLASVHKYMHVPASDGKFPDEVIIKPLESKACVIRCGSNVREMGIHDAAGYVATCLTAYPKSGGQQRVTGLRDTGPRRFQPDSL